MKTQKVWKNGTASKSFLKVLASMLISVGFSYNAMAKGGSEWQADLYAPTQVTKIDGKWIIVDCWHSRILWNPTLDSDLTKWKVLEDKFSAHSVAYDGHKYWVTEDTEHGAIAVYMFKDGNFVQTGYLNNLGARTHRTRYDANSDSFLIISATTGDMWRIKITQGMPVIKHHTRLSFALVGNPDFEIRTFTIHDNKIYFVSSLATKKVFVTTNDDSYRVLNSFDVAQPFTNMEELYFLPDGKIAASAWPDAFTIVNDAKELKSATNIEKSLGFSGSPYYLTKIGESYFIPEIGEHNGVSEWKYAHGRLYRVGAPIAVQGVSEADREKKSEIKFQI